MDRTAHTDAQLLRPLNLQLEELLLRERQQTLSLAHRLRRVVELLRLLDDSLDLRPIEQVDGLLQLDITDSPLADRRLHQVRGVHLHALSRLPRQHLGAVGNEVRLRLDGLHRRDQLLPVIPDCLPHLQVSLDLSLKERPHALFDRLDPLQKLDCLASSTQTRHTASQQLLDEGGVLLVLTHHLHDRFEILRSNRVLPVNPPTGNDSNRLLHLHVEREPDRRQLALHDTLHARQQFVQRYRDRTETRVQRLRASSRMRCSGAR